jgi:hypothetical protein
MMMIIVIIITNDCATPLLLVVVRRDVVFVLTLHHELHCLVPVLRPPLEVQCRALALANPTWYCWQALTPQQCLVLQVAFVFLLARGPRSGTPSTPASPGALLIQRC